MRKLQLFVIALALLLPYTVQAQNEVDIWGQFGKGQLAGEKIAMRAGGSFIAHAGNLLLGLNLSDAVNKSDWAYGLTTGLDLGSWPLSSLNFIWAGFDKAELGVELYGETDISDESFKFSNGTFGIGLLPDFKPGNRLKTAIKFLYHGEEGASPELRIQVGTRIEIGG
jgi:hypothetical protein